MSYGVKDLADRIRQRLEELSMSAREASIAAGGSPDMIRNIFRAAEAGRRGAPRVETLEALASVLRTNVDWLLTGGGDPKMLDAPRPVAVPRGGLPVALAGTVEPGVWRSSGGSAPGPALPQIPSFADLPQSGYEIRGHFEQRYLLRDGMFAIALAVGPYREKHGDLVSGDLVVLQRERDDGERELTIRRVAVAGDAVKLESLVSGHPEVTLPRGADATDSSRIVGVVAAAVAYFRT